MRLILLVITGFILSNHLMAQNVNKEKFFSNIDNDYFIKKSHLNDSLDHYKTFYYQLYPDSFYSTGINSCSNKIDFFFNEDVKYYLESFISKTHYNNLILCYLRYKHYETLLNKIAETKNIPSELIVLPFALTSGDVFYTDDNTGTGLWRLNYIYARYYGLRIDSLIDERRNISKSTIAVFDLLNDFHNEFNDWNAAVAAYLCGPAVVNKAFSKHQNSDFEHIYNYLSCPNKKIIPAFYALSFIFKNPEKFNFPKDLQIIYPDTGDVIYVKDSVHFMQLSEILNIPIEEIRYLNPDYCLDFVTVKNDSVKIILPENYGNLFYSNEQNIYQYKDSIYKNMIKPKYIETAADLSIIPGNETYKPPKVSKNMQEIYYTIQSGDNLGYIADWFDCTVNDLQYWNGLFSTRITAGKELLIYVPKEKASYYKKMCSLSFEQKQRLSGNSDIKTIAHHDNTSTSKKISPEIFKKGKWITYEVKSGDSPYKIAKNYPGVSDKNIMEWNNIEDPSKLKIGQKLKIKVSD